MEKIRYERLISPYSIVTESKIKGMRIKEGITA